jgi:hypothetical protein
MQFLRGDNLSKKNIKLLYKMHRTSTKNNTDKYSEIFEIFCETTKNFYVLVDDKEEILGYIHVEINGKTLNIVWMHGPNQGKNLIKNLEKHFKKDVKTIRLLCPIQKEHKKASIIRLKFFIKMNYKIEDFFVEKNCDNYFKMAKHL